MQMRSLRSVFTDYISRPRTNHNRERETHRRPLEDLRTRWGSSLLWHRWTMPHSVGAPSGATINDSEQCLYQHVYQQISTVYYYQCLKSDTSVISLDTGRNMTATSAAELRRQRFQYWFERGCAFRGPQQKRVHYRARTTSCDAPCWRVADLDTLSPGTCVRPRVSQVLAKGTSNAKGSDGRSLGAFAHNMLLGGRRWFRTTDPLLVRQVLSP